VAADPTRRVVLAATAALPLLVTGCKGIGPLAAPPQLPPDVRLLQAAISAEQLMIARYIQAIRVLRGGPGDLDSALARVLAQHRAHLAQLRSRLIIPARAAATFPAGRGGRGRVPAAPRQALKYLQAAEREAAARLLRQLLAAPPALAQLLASVSASEATHGPFLAEAAGRPR
jgi:hypothetical protein